MEDNNVILNRIKSVISKLETQLIAKNSDYGSSVFDAPRFVHSVDSKGAILIRIGDKLKRLEQLSQKETQQVSDESFDDTLFDIAGYIMLYFACN